MIPMQQALIEKAGVSFNQEGMRSAREKTWEAVRRIAASIKSGMLEEDAYELSRKILEEMGSSKNWHRPWVRFGSNTLKPYGVLSQRGTRLGETDIFFIDIGPVWNGFEGDAGATFVTGDDPDMRRCLADARRIYDAVKDRWEMKRESGQALYVFAQEETRRRGWELNLAGAGGHRLSDFPHALHYKGKLSGVDFAPSPYVWVLEIQIRHPERPFGAFYEDLLF